MISLSAKPQYNGDVPETFIEAADYLLQAQICLDTAIRKVERGPFHGRNFQHCVAPQAARNNDLELLVSLSESSKKIYELAEALLDASET